MWQELVKDEIWYTENFINEDLVDQTLEKIYSSETKELDANEQKHIISKSHYNYNHVKYDIHKDKEVVLAVIGKLNQESDVGRLGRRRADGDARRRRGARQRMPKVHSRTSRSADVSDFDRDARTKHVGRTQRRRERR